MTDILVRPDTGPVTRTTYVADDPLDFEDWLTIAHNLDTELVDGVMIDRMAAQYPHEWLFMWLSSILRQFARKRNLGVVLGSRTAIKIGQHGGRLPDILFVRADNSSIIRTDAIYGAPDLVIEIVSPNDRASDLIALETDYRSVGIAEIVFVDPQKKHVRLVRKLAPDDFEAVILTTGRLVLSSVPGFWIEVEWLFADTQPDEFEVTASLIREAEAAGILGGQ